MSRPGCSLLGPVLLVAAVCARAAAQTVPLPVSLNGQDVGEVSAQLRETEIVALEFQPLRARLRAALAAEQAARLPDAARAWITPSELAAAGVRVEFDFQNLTLRLSVPPEHRRIETLNLIGAPELVANRTVLPAAFSAFMNVRGGVDYIESSQVLSEGFTDPQLALENSFHLRGWVLDNETVINPAPHKAWEKRDTRVVYDMPERRWRWTFGDLDYPVTSFQNFLPMAGLSLHRENRLQPYRVTSPLGQSSFYLKEDSKVEVLVNGRTVQTLQLPAGPHQIGNFPLTGGANNVVLRITDPVGRVEYINATFFYDPGLLKAGEAEFSYAAGFPSRPDPDDPLYEYDADPAASAYHRWGLTDNLTLGWNAQALPRSQQAGGELVLSTRAGVFALEAAFTHHRALGWGHAQRLQYRYYAPPGELLGDAVFSLAVGHASDSFVPPTPFSVEPIRPGESWDFQARYSQRLTDHLSAGLAYGQQWLDGASRLRVCSLTLSHRWGRFITDLTVEHTEGAAASTGWAGFVSLIINLGRGTTAFARHDTSTRATRAEVQYSPARLVNSFSGALGVQHLPDDETFYGHARYFGRRAEFLLSQDSHTTGEHRTSLRWGTALVYADGRFGLSRPVLDAFALFDSTGGLREAGGLGIQPQAGLYAAREDAFGPAVLPELTAYYNTRVTAEPLRPEAEFDPEEGDLLLKPTYHSGTRVRLGRPSSANVTVTLVWANGRPVALRSGTVRAANGVSAEFITNREGCAFWQGLPAGPCQATLDDYPNMPVALEIPTDKNVTVDLGTVQVPVAE